MGRRNKSGGEKKSDIAVKYGIRISTPNGYFPEDVDKIILKLEGLNATLTKETTQLQQKLEQALKEKRMIDDEYKKMKFDMSLMEVPDTSTETDFAMMSRLHTINESVGDIPEAIPDIVESTIPLDIIKDEEEDEMVFDSLVSEPRKPVPKKEPLNLNIKKGTKPRTSNIYDENGNLDIL